MTTPKNFIDLTGKTFGKLTVLHRDKNNPQGDARWGCQCTCGNRTVVLGKSLRSGMTKSCGCHHQGNTIHGMRGTPEYTVWSSMVQRCTNPLHKCFHNYGGRGITICGAWIASFAEFYRHIGARPTPKHTLERIDNEGGYTPGNVKWATRQDQLNNTRRTRKFTISGRTMSMKQWAMEFGIDKSTLHHRIDVLGWPIEKALTKPIQKHHIIV